MAVVPEGRARRTQCPSDLCQSKRLPPERLLALPGGCRETQGGGNLSIRPNRKNGDLDRVSPDRSTSRMTVGSVGSSWPGGTNGAMDLHRTRGVEPVPPRNARQWGRMARAGSRPLSTRRVLLGAMSERDDWGVTTCRRNGSCIDDGRPEKISAEETHYLFTTVALHVLAYCQTHPELFADSPRFGPPLANTFNAEIGPTMDVTIEGDHAYAIGDQMLHVLDITEPGRPHAVGRLDGLGNVRQIVVESGLAYITSREDGLFIVDVTDPTKPELVSRYDTIEFATGICKSGDVLFVACRQYGVELIDVSDPASPQHVVHTDRRGPVGHRAERHPVRRRLGCVGGSGGGRTQPVEAANHIAYATGRIRRRHRRSRRLSLRKPAINHVSSREPNLATLDLAKGMGWRCWTSRILSHQSRLHA